MVNARRSPLAAYLGITFDECRNGHSRLTLSGRPETANRQGNLHGGALAALLDMAMSAAVQSAAEDVTGAATVSMSISYIAPSGLVSTGRGQLLRIGRYMAFATGQALDGSGTVVAVAQGSYRLIRARSPSEPAKSG